MEAALCLGYGPFIPITAPPSPTSTKHPFGFNRSFTSVSSRRKCHHRFYSTFGPSLAIDKSKNASVPSTNEKAVGNDKVVPRAVGASLALACALSIIGCSCKMNYFTAIAGPKQQVHQKAPSFQQFTPVPPRKMAVKSLLDVTVSLASNNGRRGSDITMDPSSPSSPSRHFPSSSKDQIDQLKKEAVSLMKSGKPDEALLMLKHEYKKYELSDPESAYNMYIVLVEILICQGKYEEAFQLMSDRDQRISDFDVRPILYKAIVCTMLDRDDEAQQLWEEFATTSGIFPYGF